MLARVFCIAIIALFALTAKAIGIEDCIGEGTGALQCCDAVKNSTDPELIATLKALNITLPQPGVLFGLNCTAHGFPGLGGNPCGNQVAACCMDNGYKGNVSGRCEFVDFGILPA